MFVGRHNDSSNCSKDSPVPVALIRFLEKAIGQVRWIFLARLCRDATKTVFEKLYDCMPVVQFACFAIQQAGRMLVMDPKSLRSGVQ